MLGVAGFGLVLGHWLTYASHVPDIHERAHVLAQTGHGYLPVASQFAVLAGIATFAIVFLGRLMRRDRGAVSALRIFVWLAGFQVGAFLAMEVLERAASGAPVSHLFHGSILPLGVFLQIAIAALGAMLLRLLLRVADTIAHLVEAIPLRQPSRIWAIVDAGRLGPDSGAFDGAPIRGPPPLLLR